MVVKVLPPITREEFRKELEREIEEAEERVTMEEFRAQGEADILTDGHLRDLWLHYGDVLFND